MLGPFELVYEQLQNRIPTLVIHVSFIFCKALSSISVSDEGATIRIYSHGDSLLATPPGSLHKLTTRAGGTQLQQFTITFSNGQTVLTPITVTTSAAQAPSTDLGLVTVQEGDILSGDAGQELTNEHIVDVQHSQSETSTGKDFSVSVVKGFLSFGYLL